MTDKQNKLYWRMWGLARRSKPDLDRKELHKQLELPESHLLFSQRHLDSWISGCKSIGQPANFFAQVAQEKMPATRHRVFVRQLATALQHDDQYVEAIARRMTRYRHRFTSVETMSEAQAHDLMIALKEECRRRWPKKEDLLLGIAEFVKAAELDYDSATAAIREALHIGFNPDLSKLVYEDLLVVLAVLRPRARLQVEEPF